MIGMNIQSHGHTFQADTPDQLDRLLCLLKAGYVQLAVFLFGWCSRKAA